MLHLYDTLAREKRPFKSIEEGKVGMYSCGPTVYGSPHIGNLRAYIFSDTLRRTLEFLGYEVTQVVNITDVGHLTSDGDAGEDKMEKGARAANKTVWEVARGYEDEFLRALDALNIRRPHHLPRATEHIAEQVAIIEQLDKKGFVYQASDGLYFDTAKFPDYGKLSRQKLEEKEAGARVGVNDEKKSPADFALWKFCVGDNADHIMRWQNPKVKESPLHAKGGSERERAGGFGFPGWHIECSAMSEKYLGEHFDIHTGGIDHIPVHHENEIAQSEAAHGHPFVNFWLHCDFMTVDGGKMSKSLGNVYTLADLEARGIDPLAFRLLCLGSHYRSKVNFTWEALESKQKELNRLRKQFHDLADYEDSIPKYANDAEVKMSEDTFRNAIEDDLNTPKALAELHRIFANPDINPNKKKELAKKFDLILGIGVNEPPQTKEIGVSLFTAEQENLLRERENARKNKNWVRADEIRDLFAKQGYEIIDTPNGPALELK